MARAVVDVGDRQFGPRNHVLCRWNAVACEVASASVIADRSGMAGPLLPLFDRSFLQSEFEEEYRRFRNNGTENALLARLTAWHARTLHGETEIEAAFIGRFFEDTWGYRPDGHGEDFSLRQQFAVPGAGAGGASGSADLALGRFGEDGSDIPQVLCEFKGVGADLDRPQARKGSRRSPAEQALDYLRYARRGLFDSAPVLPRYAIVTDMDQFRLYWYDRAPLAAMTFRIGARSDLFDASSLLGLSEREAFDRFLFWRLFQPDMLTSDYGRTRLERLLERQGSSQRKLEKKFYEEYRAYRLRLYELIKLQALGDASPRDKLRATQKLLDRLVFLMFSEDMGRRVAFPPRMLRDMLARESLDPFYEGDDDRIWRRLQRTFAAMNAGGRIGEDEIPRFNGGLFEPDPLIDAIVLPNHAFCMPTQGRNDATIASDKTTLLYIAATYDFSADPEGEAQDAIGLYTLGHIFEQSIVELEILEAEAEDRPSLAAITKRKRDGVYYTPEPIVRRIIEETAGPLLAAWKRDAGWEDAADPTRAAADEYWRRLSDIRIVDPACGSGAFLISAYRYLFAEMRIVADTRQRLGYDNILEDAALSRRILVTNIYGVDINPLSVEIAQLSLWLHSAYPREPLSRFVDTIKCGNSLVCPAIYDREDVGSGARERVNAFDWDAAFPAIAARGGFDLVVGNPPYVKLQNFRRIYAETASWLRDGGAGGAEYVSTTTGNFDLYLPFIEKGLALLNPTGRMGYIAPNLWPTLEYGEALRTAVVAGRNLEKWIDFRAHQVFEEATIYTAIQIFAKQPCGAIRVAFAPDGDMEAIDWSYPDATVDYGTLDGDGEAWLFAPDGMRTLIGRLGEDCDRLDDPALTSHIFQGLITSADHIYHLQRVGDGRYVHQPKPINRVRQPPIEVRIEDEIMKPLVSGAEARRFMAPATETYILFPYAIVNRGVRLRTTDEMERQFPGAWEYLLRFQTELRGREASAFDDPDWYRFGRSQNIDKQENAKLIVPRLVPSLRVAMDETGSFYCDNVDVGGVIPANIDDLDYLGGILGSPIIGSIFRWLSKPFRGEYLSANKQFIAPLPIPRAGDADRAEVGRIARALQTDYTERKRLRVGIDARLGRVSRRKRAYEWLLPDVRPIAEIEQGIVNQMEGVRRKMAARLYEEQVESALARVGDAIRLDSVIEADFADGELILQVDGESVASTFVNDADAPFLLAQWQVAALGFEPRGPGDGKRLIDKVREVGLEAPTTLLGQIIERQEALGRIGISIRDGEEALHNITCRLFALTPEELRLIGRH